MLLRIQPVKKLLRVRGPPAKLLHLEDPV